MRKHGYGRIINLSSGVGQLSVLGFPSPAVACQANLMNHWSGACRSRHADEPERLCSCQACPERSHALNCSRGRFTAHVIDKWCLFITYRLLKIKPEEDILVNALLPGFVRTDMSKKVVPDEFPQQVLQRQFVESNHLVNEISSLGRHQVGSRWRTPEEVGGDVVHLVSQPGRDGPRGHLFLEGKQQPW